MTDFKPLYYAFRHKVNNHVVVYTTAHKIHIERNSRNYERIMKNLIPLGPCLEDGTLIDEQGQPLLAPEKQPAAELPPLPEVQLPPAEEDKTDAGNANEQSLPHPHPCWGVTAKMKKVGPYNSEAEIPQGLLLTGTDAEVDAYISANKKKK